MKKNIVIGASGVLVVIVCILMGLYTGHSNISKSTADAEKNFKSSVTSDNNPSTLISQPSSSVITSSENASKSDLSKSSSSQSSLVNDPNTASYDPNKTAQGTEVTNNMINKARSQLLAAGLPADKWAPSDIKKIITESSQQNMSIVEYAKVNYHQ